MPDEKADDRFHWKDKLDKLDRLPGEAPVYKEAGWQQLHDRLQKRPHHKKRSGYWMAAACLLGVMLLTRILLMQPGETLVEMDAHPTPYLPKTLPVTDNRQPVASLETAKKKVRPLGSENKSLPALVKDATTGMLVQLADTVKELLSEADINQQPVDTVHLIAAAPKKKLRVVHINELDRPGDDAQLASIDPEPSSAKLMRENDSHFSISRNASDNIVKIKLSSSN